MDKDSPFRTGIALCACNQTNYCRKSGRNNLKTSLFYKRKIRNGCSHAYPVLFILLVCLHVLRCQATSEYVIDTLVVVDDVMYDNWRLRLSPNLTAESQAKVPKLMKEYVSLLVHQANRRLETIREHASFGLRLQVSGVILNEGVLTFLPGNILTRRINGDKALETFQEWVLDREGLASDYDHAMLLTGKPMESSYEGAGQDYVAGRAYVGTICDDGWGSVSVVHDDGGFQGVYFIAHEAAHILGALHDGEPGADACPESDLYLMAPGSQFRASEDGKDTQTNPWYFSRCSADSIADVILNVSTSNSNCLESSLPPIPEFTATDGVQAGQVYNASRQCQMIYGPNSGLCLGEDFSMLEDICTSMYCARTTSSCVRHIAAEGTSCGNKTWCQMGRCAKSDQAPELGSCPFGDTALALGRRSTCSDYISLSPSACYTDSIRTSCCKSCANIHSGSQVCPYGDRSSRCSAAACDQIRPDGTVMAERCCATCAYSEPLPCEDVAQVDGFTCRERINAYGKQECYNSTVAFHCCRSCAAQRRDVRGCEYGDFITGTHCRSEARYDNSGCTGSLRLLCCETCNRKFQTAAEGGDLDHSYRLVSNQLLCLVATCLPIISIRITYH